jgi:hypothetical protein
MTIRIINGALRAAMFGGAVALLSPVAFADEAANTGAEAPIQIPDHSQAESRAGAANVVPTVEKGETPPDHAEAQARGPAANVPPMAERMPGVPDHETAQNRGAVQK